MMITYQIKNNTEKSVFVNEKELASGEKMRGQMLAFDQIRIDQIVLEANQDEDESTISCLEDPLRQISGVGGEYLSKYGFDEDSDFSFLVCPEGQGD